MKRLRIGIAILLLGAVSMIPAAGSVDTDPPKDAEYTHARIRYHMSFEGRFARGELPWHHDYPFSDETFTGFVKAITNIHTYSTAYQIVDIDSPDLFKYPFAYISEPGFMDLNDADIENLRQYVERGGFLFFDDFRGQAHWSNLVYQMTKVFPNRRFEPLTIQHPVFDIFYKVESLEMRPPYGFEPVSFMGMKDDHDQLIAIANYNNDLGEIWQWLDEGRASLHDAAESLKLGTNYLMYAFTH
jgi:hypothetical protein